MPTPSQSGRRQTAILAPLTGINNHGQSTFTGPTVELTVRWENHQRLASDVNGNPVAISADVEVDRVIPIGSLMWLGTLTAWNTAKLATDVPNVFEVATMDDIPDVKVREIVHSAGLTRYRGSLPSGV